MWLAFVMTVSMPVGMDGRGMVGPFKTQQECEMYLSYNRSSAADYCAEPSMSGVLGRFGPPETKTLSITDLPRVAPGASHDR